MRHISVDTVIIGAGTAGMQAYKTAVENNADTIIIEQGPLGPTSITSGCVPSQLLHEMGRQFSSNSTPMLTMTLYGKSADKQLERSEILNSVRNEKRAFLDQYIKEFYTIPEDCRIMGKAFFIDPYTVAIEGTDTTISARSFVIATGSKPYVPAEFQRIGNRVITSSDLFELKELPQSIAIFGTGSIGLELGEYLTRLNVKTVIFGKGDIGHLTDPKVAASALNAIKERVFIVPYGRFTTMEQTDDSVVIYYLDETDHECYLKVDYVLCATGRIPNLDELQLETAGIQLNSLNQAYCDEETLQTSVPHIFIAGDTTSSTRSNLQKALYQGKIAGANAATYPRLYQTCNMPHQDITFTDPEITVTGLSFEEVKQRARTGRKFILGESSTADNTTSVIKGYRHGLVHVYFDRETQLLLGAEICAPYAQQMSQFIYGALYNRQTLDDLIGYNFYHPSAFEMLTEAFEDAKKSFKLLGPVA